MIQKGDRVINMQTSELGEVASLGRELNTGEVVKVKTTEGAVWNAKDLQIDDEDRALTEAELSTLVDAVQAELADDISELLPWLGLLSNAQKRQLWGALSAGAKDSLKSPQTKHAA